MALVATLIANPSNPVLLPALGEAACNAVDGAGLYWLADGVACDIALKDGTDKAAALATLHAVIGEAAVDVAVQEAESRRKKILIADMDSTMIGQECIDELAEEAGVGAHVREITARAMNGELDFEGALTERVALLKGLDEAVIGKVLAQRITFMPGGRELVATMQAEGAHAVLVSGGFTAFTGHVAAALGFDEARANTLLVDGGRLTGEEARPILGRAAKVQALEEISARLGISEAEVIAVGDGANDLGMLGRAGTGVALHAKPSVQAECEIRVNHGDLTALLFLQGYPREAFRGA